jgi:prepilin-type N-terminal cleavage/methylation domain-containing protein
MGMHKHDERGDTLVEILVAMVIIGVVMASFLGAITNAANASRTHRNLVTADAVLRDYAESTKQAARATCNAGNAGASFVPTYTPPPSSGITVPTPTGLTCPSVTSVSTVVITANLPDGLQKSLSLDVRTQ